MVEYDYLAVICKTPHCKQQIVIYCFGQHSDYSVPVLDFPGPLEIKCQLCHVKHVYRGDELIRIIDPEPPDDFVDDPRIQPK